ncbi:MAG: DUF3489 domain-containing protein [Ferrovum myxofaciens]|uniref:DUF3489 domain-containing protein n=1 Tax=Ferrovum myxofaciens TaxID=416213 RepID=UPI002355B60D|nr:DUF3489 domain-containing protein [Ferrovum myxofaciens]QKE40294.1 MAG: DUF3489 domain-containing protein [Ferrovum myxofaciens]
MKTEFTAAQHAILAHAIHNTDGKIAWFPDNIKGGARKKVLEGLFNRVLITPLGSDWFVAAEGYDALGVPRPGPIAVEVLDEIIKSAEVTDESQTPVRRTRDNSKQATVIGMLKRPEGATIPQICEVTGWLAHTVRGTFTGALKKKLGLIIVSDKIQGRTRVYRID